jgi:hypothetical protein
MPLIQKLYADDQNKQITVLFTLTNGVASWTFTPDTLTMDKSGDIDYSSTAGTQFVGFAIKPGSPNPNNGEFSNTRISGNGKKMTVADDDDTPKGGLPREYDYSVTVLCNGTNYSSDPKIINDPPPDTGARVAAREATQ